MSVLSVAIVGKNNEPLYMKEFSTGNDGGSNSIFEDEEELFGFTTMNHDEPESAMATPGESQCSIRQQFILHAALDRFEQLAGPPPGFGWRKPGVSGSEGMFVGLLYPIEQMRVYGYMTTTKIKFLIVVEDEALPEHQQAKDASILSIVVKLHGLYVNYLLNPFNKLDGMIESARFEEGVRELVAAFNQTTQRYSF